MNDNDLQFAQSRIYQLIAEGKTASEIKDDLTRLGYRATREQISKLLWGAVKDVTLSYTPQPDESLQNHLTDLLSRKWEDCRAWVLNTDSVDHVAHTAARALLQSVCERWEQRRAALIANPIQGVEVDDEGLPIEESHFEAIKIGIAPGRTPNRLAFHLAKLIAERCRIQDRISTDGRTTAKSIKKSDARLPRMIMLHTMCGVLASGAPDSNPNVYPYYFRDIAYPTMRFVSLPAPGLLAHREWLNLQDDNTMVKDSLRWKDQLDFVVISSGHFGDNHSSLCDYVRNTYYDPTEVDKKSDFKLYNRSYLSEKWERVKGELVDQHGCIADMMWRPINRNGPIEDDKIKNGLRVATLIELNDLQSLIRGMKKKALKGDGKQTKVTLLLGPCGGKECGRTKAEILQAVYDSDIQIATDIFIDIATAKDFVRMNRRGC